MSESETYIEGLFSQEKKDNDGEKEKDDKGQNGRDRERDRDRDRRGDGGGKKPNFFEDLRARENNPKKEEEVVEKKEQVPDPLKELYREQSALDLQFSSFSGSIPFFDAWIDALKSYKLKAPNEKFVRVDTKVLHDKVSEIYLMYQFQFELASTAIKNKQPYEVFAESYNIEYPEYVKRRWVAFAPKIGTDHGVEHYLSELLVPADAQDKVLGKLPQYNAIEFSMRNVRNPEVKKVVHMINWYRTQGANWSNLTQQLLLEFSTFMQGLSQNTTKNKSLFNQLTKFSVDPKVTVTLRNLAKRLATNDGVSRSLQSNLSTMYKGGGF